VTGTVGTVTGIIWFKTRICCGLLWTL